MRDAEASGLPLAAVRHAGCGGELVWRRAVYVPALEARLPEALVCRSCGEEVPSEQRDPPGAVCLTPLERAT